MRTLLLSLLFCGSIFSLSAQNVNRWYQDGKVIFQLKENVKKPISNDGIVKVDQLEFLSEIISEYDIQQVVHLHPNIDDKKLIRTYQIEFNNIDKVESLVADLGKVEALQYAEKKELHESFLTPNDQYFSNSFSNGQWALYQIDAPQAWDISTGSSDVVVAVTDNAININHPDLVNKMVPGWDAVDNDNDPSPCGGNDGFHGSHVSGIVGAETNNNIGVASIGYNVSIMPVKIGDCNTGSLTSGYDGIIWAADNGADVINMSWGGGGSSTYGQNVCNYAWNLGSILIAAAGNDGTSQQFYPAAYNNVVAVASTTSGDSKSGFSQYGTWVDISAPGSSILSTNEGTGYQITQGTSMASPLVAGLVGLMISHAPSAPQQEVVNCLLSTADNIDGINPSYAGQLGSGRINAYQALLCMNQFTYALDVGISAINDPVGSICSASVDPQIVLTNYGGNTVTSATIEYQIDAGPIDVFNWTGNLAQGQSTTITLPTQTPGGGAHIITVTAVNPNGTADQNSSNDSETSNFTIVVNGQIADLTIITDCYGSEITWQIDEDGTGTTVATGGPYADITGGETNVENVCLDAGCYVFTINDSYGDGLYGSQWTCTVDGDYYMQDQVGTQLFQMTAPNGDFGSQTTHNFCITSNVSLDAGISNVSSPNGTICGSTVDPMVQLNNYGTSTLTSVDIIYNIGGANQTYSWSGSLTQGSNTIITLPTMTVSTGSYTFTAYTNLPNGSTDLNQLNDQSTENFSLFTGSQPLPFSEDFESNSFATNSWTITNPDNGITWEVVTVAGSAPGDKAAKVDLYNYGNGFERDGMQTPPLDFSNYSNVSMTFDHAFRRYDANSADSLVLWVSTDCGNTFDRIAGYAEDGTGSLATAYTSTVEFIPVTGDWCTGTVGANCFTIDLSAYDGQPSVVVRFESFNNGIAGNNIYIDNINIDGTQLNNPPTANYSSDPTLCLGEDINFTDNSLGSPTSWSWDFGDGSGTSTAQNPTYNYASSGTYTVTLTVTNAFGSDSYSQTVTVNALPNVNASSPSTSICIGQSANINASGASSYAWDNGAGSGPSVNVSPSATTTYQVTGTDGNGCVSTANINITVNAAPVISSTSIADPSACLAADGAVTIGSSGTGDLSWAGPINGSANNTTLPYIASGLSAGTYTFSFIDNNGCSAQDITATITDPNSPAAPTISQGNLVTICAGQSADLTSSYSSGNTWSTTETSQSITVNSVGNYSVYYTDPSGCISATTVVEVVESPPLNITTSGNASVCIGNSLTITASGASAYVWDNGAGSSASVTVAPTTNTTYTVTGTDANGCQGQAQVSVVVNQLPVVTTNADFAICFGASGTLSALGASTYTWDNGAGTGPNVSVSPISTTTYTVIGTDFNGCQNTSSVTVSINPLPAVSITPSTLDTLCSNGSDPITLSGTPQGGTFSGPGVINAVFDPSAVGAGSYNINYTYTDINGCSGTSALQAIVVDCSSLENTFIESVMIIPNPNNGNFIVAGLDANTEFKIIDTRGRLILEEITNAYQNGNSSINNLESGIYYLYGTANGKNGVLRFVVTN
ncbi:MAG: S8 family serine peptidase [Crocinitomicaceae bacterium]